MGTQMNRAPVFYTLVQVAFNSVLQMADYVPKIQERLRREGFPDFRVDQRRKISFKLQQGQGEAPQVTTEDAPATWNFDDAAKTSGYILQPNGLVYHTTAYETFEVFSKRILDILGLVHEVVSLSFIERIGLRYLDAVVPEKEEKLSQYIYSGVLGLSEALPGKLSHSFTEVVSTSNDGTLVARVLVTDGDLAVPPDLFPIRLKVADRFTAIKGRHAVLDTDHFVADRFDFNLERVRAILDTSHARIADAFRFSATDYARKVWYGGNG